MEENNNGYKRAVLYARTSYDDRDTDGRNLAGQLEMARQYALSKGYSIVGEIAEDDRGASGAAFELEGLNRAREMATNGEFDVLIPREIDRLSRNLAKQLIVEEELRRAGVSIEYAMAEYPDTPEGRLQKHIRATIAEYERELIVQRMERGRRNKVKAGEVVTHGRAPYGYDTVKEDGKTLLVIREDEAQVVRQIYDWYVRGDETGQPLTIRQVTLRLTGIPTWADTRGLIPKIRNPGVWSRSVVSRMIKNETYAGVWHYGKRHTRARKQNPDEHLISVEVPAIVDRKTWQAAQDRLAANKADASRNRKYDYLLTGRVKCGRGNHRLRGHGNVTGTYKLLYYTCHTSTNPDVAVDVAYKCDLPNFRADQVDAVVWGWIKDLLTDPESFARGLYKHQAEREKENVPIRERLDVVDDLLDNHRKQLDRLLDLYLTGGFAKDVLTDRKNRLETTIGGLERERAGLVAALDVRTMTEEQIQDILSFTQRVTLGLEEAEHDFDARRRIIELLDVQATLDEEDGVKVAYVSCIVHPDREKLSVVPSTT